MVVYEMSYLFKGLKDQKNLNDSSTFQSHSLQPCRHTLSVHKVRWIIKHVIYSYAPYRAWPLQHHNAIYLFFLVGYNVSGNVFWLLFCNIS